MYDALDARDYGVNPGNSDNSTALGQFWAACASEHRLGILPAGDLPIASPVALPPNSDHWAFRGQSKHLSRLLYTGTNPTASILSGYEINHFEASDFAVASETQMTDGNGVHLELCGFFGLDRVEVRGTKIWTGIHFDKVQWGRVSVDVLDVSKRGLIVNGALGNGPKAELDLDKSVIAGCGDIGIWVAGSFGGLYLGQVSVSHCLIGYWQDTSKTGEGNREIFIGEHAVFDGCIYDGLHVKDAGGSFHLNGWSASNGGSGITFEITPEYTSLGNIDLFNNHTHGIDFQTVGVSQVSMATGGMIRSNYNYGVNSSGPITIHGQPRIYGNGAGWISSGVSFVPL